MMLSLTRGSSVQVFNLTAGNSDSISLPLTVGQQVSGSFSVSSVGDDRQIDFRVMNPEGARMIDYGTVSNFAEFNFTAYVDGDYTFQFFNVPRLSFDDKTVTLTYDVTAAIEASGPDYFVYSVIAIIVLGLAVTFIFIAHDRRRLRRSNKVITRRPMVRAA